MNDLVAQSALYNQTIDLLINRPRGLTLDKINFDTGLTKAWLKSLVQGRNDPSAGKLEKLYCYLSGRRLEF